MWEYSSKDAEFDVPCFSVPLTLFHNLFSRVQDIGHALLVQNPRCLKVTMGGDEHELQQNLRWVASWPLLLLFWRHLALVLHRPILERSMQSFDDVEKDPSAGLRIVKCLWRRECWCCNELKALLAPWNEFVVLEDSKRSPKAYILTAKPFEVFLCRHCDALRYCVRMVGISVFYFPGCYLSHAKIADKYFFGGRAQKVLVLHTLYMYSRYLQ